MVDIARILKVWTPWCFSPTISGEIFGDGISLNNESRKNTVILAINKIDTVPKENILK